MSRIKIDDVRQDVESYGWKLISTEYVNLKTPLELECPKGHQVDIDYSTWRNSQLKECPLCVRQTTKKLNEKVGRKSGYRILALDQSTHITGWALFENGNLISYGKWQAKSSHTTPRISEVKDWLDYQINAYSVDEVCLEDIQLQKVGGDKDGEENVLTFKTLAQLQGVLKNYLYETGILYKVVPVASWRALSNVKGCNRTERKKSAQMKVSSLYGINADVDSSEAILIGRWAVNEHKSNSIIQF